MRLFVGLALPDHVRTALSYIQGGVPDARWVKSENMHVTLRFLGEVDRHQAADLDTEFSHLQAPGFDLSYRGTGSFGSKGRVRDLWAGLASSDALHHLQAKVESATVRCGLLPERRKFKPHTTLARFRDAPERHVSPFLEQHAGFVTRPFEVYAFVLFQSHLGREGAHYEQVAEYPLFAYA